MEMHTAGHAGSALVRKGNLWVRHVATALVGGGRPAGGGAIETAARAADRRRGRGVRAAARVHAADQCGRLPVPAVHRAARQRRRRHLGRHLPRFLGRPEPRRIVGGPRRTDDGPGLSGSGVGDSGAGAAAERAHRRRPAYGDRMKIVVLDDYQRVARTYGPFDSLPDAEVEVLHECIADLDELAWALRGAEVVVAMRERTPFR